MSTRTNIIIKDSNQPVQRLIYHHCDGYFEGVGCEIKNEILPIYIDNHKSFHVNDLWAEIIDFDEQYMNSECIHGDIEYLYMLEVISDSVLKFKCWSVPCFGTYDYTTNENCALIYEADIFINGRKKGAACGSFSSRSFFSSTVKIKCPPSAGFPPLSISGTSEIGFDLA